MGKIRILYTISELMYGSKLRQLMDLVQGLNKRKFEIEIGASVLGNEATQDVINLGFPVKEIRVQPPRTLNKDRLVKFFKSPMSLYRYDIVHSLHYSSFFFEAAFVRSFPHTKYIYTKTNLQWENHPINWKLKSSLSNSIVAISSPVQKILNKNGFKENVVYSPIGIDTKEFQPGSLSLKEEARKILNLPQRGFIFGCPAQFIKLKGHETLVNAFQKLSSNYDNVYLALCGQNYNDDYYSKIVNMCRNDLKKKIFLLGTLRDMPNFYKAVDCMVLPSTYEALGLVYMEALSSEVPVIGCRETGAEDIIEHSRSGFLVSKENAMELYSVMEKYLVSPRMSHYHGCFGRKVIVQKFSKERMIDDHEKIYSDLIGNSSERS